MLLIGDIGSTHRGSFAQAELSCRWLCQMGIRPKVQLCPDDRGNIPAKPEWMSDLAKYGCSASVWTDAGYRAVKAAGTRWIKFSYSQRYSDLIPKAIASTQIDEIFITTDVMSDRKWNSPKIKWLYTYTVNGEVQYPVICQLNFEPLFHGRFAGFSSHCLDLYQNIAAAEAGASVLEFHANITRDKTCPDSKFALTIKEIEEMLKCLKNSSLL